MSTVLKGVSVFAEYKAMFYHTDSDEVDNVVQHLVGGDVRFHF